jgi:hypothetical protein
MAPEIRKEALDVENDVTNQSKLRLISKSSFVWDKID